MTQTIIRAYELSRGDEVRFHGPNGSVWAPVIRALTRGDEVEVMFGGDTAYRTFESSANLSIQREDES